MRIPLDLTKFQKRNVWTNPSGEMVVRPGLHRAAAIPFSSIGAAFSVQNSRTGETWHYVVLTATTTRVVVYDEDFNEVEDYDTGSTVPCRAASYAVIGDQILIASPDFPSVWGIVGSGLVLATPVSDGSDAVPLDIPRGICVAWADRAIVADSNTLYFSSGGTPQTFKAFNVAASPGGNVFGLTVSAGGALVLATTTGVWALPQAAAASGDIVNVTQWSKLTDYCCASYNNVANVRGRLLGLTARGYRRIDQEGAAETIINESPDRGPVSADLTPAMIFPDLREGRLLEGEKGPIISIGLYTYMEDTATNTAGWWYINNASFGVAGVLLEQDGTEMYVDALGSNVLRLSGNQDTGVVEVLATWFSHVDIPPDYSTVVRYVDFTTDAYTNSYVAVNDTGKASGVLPQQSPVIGTDAWGTAIYYEGRVRSRQFMFAERLDRIAVTIAVQDSLARVGGAATVTTKGPGKKRPNQ